MPKINRNHGIIKNTNTNYVSTIKNNMKCIKDDADPSNVMLEDKNSFQTIASIILDGPTMEKGIKILFIVIMYLVLSSKVDGSKEKMHNLSINFRKPLEECKKEMELPDYVDQDFDDFWKEDFAHFNRFLGCAIWCLSTKLDLLDPNANLHHGNAHEFALKHGADETMAKTLVNIIHGCFTAAPAIEDLCFKVLEISKCYKTEIHNLDWAPSNDLVVGEILAEV